MRKVSYSIVMTSEQAWNKFPQRINIVRVVDNALTSYLIGGATETTATEAEYILNTVRRRRSKGNWRNCDDHAEDG